MRIVRPRPSSIGLNFPPRSTSSVKPHSPSRNCHRPVPDALAQLQFRSAPSQRPAPRARGDHDRSDRADEQGSEREVPHGPSSFEVGAERSLRNKTVAAIHSDPASEASSGDCRDAAAKDPSATDADYSSLSTDVRLRSAFPRLGVSRFDLNTPPRHSNETRCPDSTRPVGPTACSDRRAPPHRAPSPPPRTPRSCFRRSGKESPHTRGSGIAVRLALEPAVFHPRRRLQ